MFTRIIKSIFFVLSLLTIVFAGMIFFLLHSSSIDFSALEHYNPGSPSIVFDYKGNEWTRFQLDRREPVNLASMPPQLINAFLAAEDWKFFSHNGISIKGIIRSFLVNIYHGRRAQGASTITQQLVRLLFFESKKTISRKIKEQLYALLVEQQFSKEQILQTYLNHVYFGCGIYGVQAACKRFWSKDVTEVTIDQAATLAAIVQSPGRYCPLLYPLSAQKRRNTILGSMYKLGFISQEECEHARQTLVSTVGTQKNGCGHYLREMIRQKIEELVGKQRLYTGGLHIQTTIDVAMQEKAERAFKKHCEQLKKDICKEVDGGMIAMHTQTGAVRALVGGMDFEHSKFNRATQARRQMGSVFKPLLYAAAIEQGAAFWHTHVDEPIELVQGSQTWAPKNWNSRFNGQITLAYALSHSNNIVTIKTLLQTGIQHVIDVAKRAHVPDPIPAYPSLALGCVDATLMQALASFNIFPNQGIYVKPFVITWVKDTWGKKIYKHSAIQEHVLSPRVNSLVAKVLELGLKRVKKMYHSSNWIQCDAMSKTGTTNESRTCWFLGATPGLTTGIYIGCDDNRSMGTNIYPIATAFPIWLAFNKDLDPPGQTTFAYDAGLREVVINEFTGERTDPHFDKHAVSIFV